MRDDFLERLVKRFDPDKLLPSGLGQTSLQREEVRDMATKGIGEAVESLATLAALGEAVLEVVKESGLLRKKTVRRAARRPAAARKP